MFKIKLSLIILFADQSCLQTDVNYYKILLDSKNIISKEINVFTPSLETSLKELFEEYVKIDFEWPIKYLGDCRKINDTIEITYICKMPFLKDCIKNGSVINIQEFNNLYTEEYYGKILSSGSIRSFR